MSNQCCYANGVLMEGGYNPALIGAGRMHRELNSLYNLQAHFWNDLYPYTMCCFRMPPYRPQCQEKFRNLRKTITGTYWPHNIRFNRGDPDIETADGVNYPFMGLGVYTMLTTSQDVPTNIQVSMRRLGNGTVFSGIAVKYDGTLLECHITEDGVFTLAINSFVMSNTLYFYFPF